MPLFRNYWRLGKLYLPLFPCGFNTPFTAVCDSLSSRCERRKARSTYTYGLLAGELLLKQLRRQCWPSSRLIGASPS